MNTNKCSQHKPFYKVKKHLTIDLKKILKRDNYYQIRIY